MTPVTPRYQGDGPGRTARLSARVFPAMRDEVNGAVAELRRRGMETTSSELLAAVLYRALEAAPDELEANIRRWRAEAPRR